ncbi:putative lysine decarboxylase [Mytilinidion resinicola]|uniref:Lysine decarboxylase n=1 Tax=Mytilinidion resinicola TaxID=574789 RepID=A0A6A6YP87_9PEZI|nr:putative lysine decarboxylase [Mytilinidion resinicola]KAF2810692.1 putative lysine decarboxylase [Mytilinidion resinicola]
MASTTTALTPADAIPKLKGPVVCVFCGANPGSSPTHLAAARALAHAMATHELSLVYGGGTTGLMGEVARTLVSLSGSSSVLGIIPAALVKHEQQSPSPTSLLGHTAIVKDMHTRKRLMAEAVVRGGAGGGFVALSGGYGTLEELMEVTTWNQLGIHAMPVVIYNVEGFWDGLVGWVQKAVGEGFIKRDCAGIMVEALSAEEVVVCLREYVNVEGRFGLDWEEN